MPNHRSPNLRLTHPRVTLPTSLSVASLLLAASLLGACGGGTSEGQAFPQGEAARAVREVHGEWRWSEEAQQVGPATSGGAAGAVGVQGGPQGAQGAQGGPVAQGGVGSSPESPVPSCGPQASYDYVARVFQCPGGGNPLGGDLRAGAGSRVGNVGANSQGHVIDLYRIPCPSGPVDVYVDMYGCPEWEQRLHEGP